MKFKPAILIITLFLSGILYAQFDTDNRIKIDVDGATLVADYDSVNFCSNLTVTSTESKKVLFLEECTERVTDIKIVDLDADGKKEVIVERFSGGAHCCTSIFIGRATNKSFVYLDSMYFGNCGYTIDDLNKDGKKEIVGCNDMFAYFFTNYSQSRFPMMIYSWVKNKLVFADKEFKVSVEKDISGMKDELKQYLDAGFECPKTENADAFNTDAGSVQSLLAAITADYSYIGESEKGYDYIDKVYNCPDKKKFVTALKNEFKIK